MRVDRIRKSLEAPYTGPFEVVNRKSKFFILKLPQGNTSVSIDRLKPFRQTTPPSTAQKPPLTPTSQQTPASPPSAQPLISDFPPPSVSTRSGRSVRFRLHPDFHYF